jgi:hypothetical protein
VAVRQRKFDSVFRRDYAPHIGLLFERWGTLEQCLISVLAHLLGTDHTRARMVFVEVISFHSKIKIMQRILHTYYTKDENREKLLGLLGEAKTVVNTRDFYAHCAWGFEIDSGRITKILAIPGTYAGEKAPFRPPEERAPSKVQEDAASVFALANRLNEFVRDVLPTMEGRPIARTGRDAGSQSLYFDQWPLPETPQR